jgi:hypothetical protein
LFIIFFDGGTALRIDRPRIFLLESMRRFRRRGFVENALAGLISTYPSTSVSILDCPFGMDACVSSLSFGFGSDPPRVRSSPVSESLVVMAVIFHVVTMIRVLGVMVLVQMDVLDDDFGLIR